MNSYILLGSVAGVYQTRPRAFGIAVASLFLSLCAFAPSASASIYTLAPGANLNAVTLSSAYPTGVGAPLDTISNAFTSSTIDGTVVSRVYSGDTSNPYGGLTFTYLLELSTASSDSSSEMTVGSYAGFTIDVSYNPAAGSAVPSNFTRSSGTGNVIRFLWSNSGGIQPGQNGDLIVVQTGAQNFTTAQGGVIDSQTVNITTLAPVPEPGITGLFITGLGGLIVAVRRRNSK